ncbi:hypothetical protein O9929_01710 [Vibrio lentus]|nr:hypothetical protein [Vibrio lentus]
MTRYQLIYSSLLIPGISAGTKIRSPVSSIAVPTTLAVTGISPYLLPSRLSIST